MMTKDEALRLALEALENHCGNYKLDDEGVKRFVAACKAIKEALSQPTSGEYALGYAEGFNDACKKPEQEPLASYLPEMSIPNFSARVAWGAPDHIDLRNGWRPLYTTPPKRPWVGLTKANIQVLIEQARIVPKKLPCPDYNERLLMLTNAVLQELNT